MEFLRQWLMSVVCCAVLVSVVNRLAPEGAVCGLVRLAGALVLLLCLLRPLGSAELSQLEVDVSGAAEERDALEERYQTERDSALAEGIAERTAAYIEDKAKDLGLHVTASVVMGEADGTLVPQAVTLYGVRNEALCALIERELGIPAERQEWREKK